MSGASRAAAAVVALSAGLSLAACATTNRATLNQTKSDAARLVAAGAYRQAIDLQKSMRRKDPGNKKVTAAYVATVEEIKRAADVARGKADYALAAGTYKILIDHWEGDRAVVSMLTFRKTDLDAGRKTCRDALLRQEVRRELKAGNFEKAIGLYQAALKERPGDRSVCADYAVAVLEIKSAGDKALAGRDFAAAGRINGLLLKNVKSFAKLAGMEEPAAAALKKERLIESIKACSRNLTNQGLAEYRKDNLEKALEIWEALLVFDPENAEIQKAVGTARAQLGKVKKIGAGDKPSASLR